MKLFPFVRTTVGVILFSTITVHAAQLPTDGFVTYNNTYSVQNWTTNVGSGYTLSNGVAITIAQYGDQRCELRWQNWPNQDTYNQFEMDEMFSPQSQNTAVHQIKSNTGGEVIYLQIQSSGTLRNDNGSVFATGMAGAFYHVNSMFNPDTGDAKCYINGSLKVTRSYPTTDRFWYFKCGCYNNGLPPGGISTAWTKNFTNWVYLTNAPPTPTHLNATASTGKVSLTWFPSPGCTNYLLQRSTTNGSGYSAIASILGTTTTNYNDTAVVNGTTYYYVIASANTFGQSANSAQVSATPIDLGFSLAASPSSQTVNAGSGTNFTMTVTTNSNFSGTINLGISGLPSGANANFSPSSFTAAGTSTLTINTVTNTPGGNYLLTIAGTNGGFAITTTATLIVSGVAANPGTLIWTAAGADTNWSTVLNWTNPIAGGNGPPGANNNLIFTNTGTVAVKNSVNNVVNANVSILSLQFSQTNNFHTTQIADGQTLTVATNLTAGTGTDLGANGILSVAIMGNGGTLSITNGVVIVRQGTGANSAGATNNPPLPPWLQRATLDLSGLGNFNAHVQRILVAGDGTNAAFNSREVGTFYLAQTNLISTSASAIAPQINIGENASNGAGGNNDPTNLTSYLYLGVTNGIFADSIGVGRSKSAGVLAFNPIFTNGFSPSVFLRGASANRVSIFSIGDELPLGNSNQRSAGTADFSGGTVDAMIDTAYIGRSMNGNNTGTATSTVGTLTFSAGTMNVNTLEIAYQTSPTGTGPGSAGTVNVNGAGQLTVNNTIELAHGNTALPLEQGTLNMNGGMVQATNVIGGGGVSTINLNSGTLDLQSVGQIENVSTLNVGTNGVNDSAVLQNVALISVSNAIAIAPNGTIAGNAIISSPGLTVNGTISPGNNFAGAITNNGTITLGAGGNFAVTIQDATAGIISGWSFLQANGVINVQSSSANPFVISVQTPNSPAANFNYNTNYDWTIATASGGIANFNSAKFTVDNSQFANDLAGGYFYVRVIGNSLVLSFTNNHPPVATQLTLWRTGNITTIPIPMLATHWSDPDGDPVALTNVAASSANGANNIGFDGANVYYTNSGATFDSFTYTVYDIRTNPPAVYQPDDTIQTATGIVNIVSQLPTLRNPAIAASGNNLIFSSSNGAPNAICYLLTSTNIALPISNWTIIATNSFDANGNFNLTNAIISNQSSQFYRLQIP